MRFIGTWRVEIALLLVVFAFFVLVAGVTGELDARTWLSLFGGLIALLGVLAYYVFMSERGGPAIGRLFDRLVRTSVTSINGVAAMTTPSNASPDPGDPRIMTGQAWDEFCETLRRAG